MIIFNMQVVMLALGRHCGLSTQLIITRLHCCFYRFVFYFNLACFHNRYVPLHLHLMVFELVKNSLRAVQERFMDSDKVAPSIRIIVADGIEDVTIKARIVLYLIHYVFRNSEHAVGCFPIKYFRCICYSI